MLSARAAITTYLEGLVTTGPLAGVAIVQEDDFTKSTAKPAIVLAYDGAERGPSREFRDQRWDFWIVAESSDYYTIGRLADVLRDALDEVSLDYVPGMAEAVLQLIWLWDGPAAPDREYGLHTMVQRYQALTLKVSP